MEDSVLGRAGCPQPAVDQIEDRISHEVRTSLGERTAEDSRPYLRDGWGLGFLIDSDLDAGLNASIASALNFLPMKSIILVILGCLGVTDGFAAEPLRIMAAGDSITAGGKTFVTYRLPLELKLRTAGFKFEFVGSQQSEGPTGPLLHEGYGGKTAEDLVKILGPKFKQAKPDILLLHCGHNHSAEEKPVAGIISAERAIIEAARKQNPHIVVLLAMVIPSGKLPKYGYIPELNQAEVLLVRELHRPDAPVMMVDQYTGFDPQKDTIMDKVHPTAQGAEKMASRWFMALRPMFAPPAK